MSLATWISTVTSFTAPAAPPAARNSSWYRVAACTATGDVDPGPVSLTASDEDSSGVAGPPPVVPGVHLRSSGSGQTGTGGCGGGGPG